MYLYIKTCNVHVYSPKKLQLSMCLGIRQIIMTILLTTVSKRNFPGLPISDNTHIPVHVKTAGDLARQLRKCTGYMLQSFIYPTQSLLFPVRYTARQKRAGHMINDRIYDVHDFCLAEHGCSASDIFYRLQHSGSM